MGGKRTLVVRFPSFFALYAIHFINQKENEAHETIRIKQIGV